MSKPLPDMYLRLGRELADLAKKYGLRGLSGHIIPGRWGGWDSEIQFDWNDGRHGVCQNRIMLTSTITECVELPGDDEK